MKIAQHTSSKANGCKRKYTYHTLIFASNRTNGLEELIDIFLFLVFCMNES